MPVLGGHGGGSGCRPTLKREIIRRHHGRLMVMELGSVSLVFLRNAWL